MASAHDVDAVVVGAGPAGAAAATRLAQLGQRVLVLESEVFPRFHIGESLLPCTGALFEQLGCGDRIAAAGYVQKFGAQLLTPDGGHRVLFDFQAARVAEPPFTWQVRRADFDALLLQHAVASGARVIVGRASDYRSDQDGVDVAYVPRDGAEATVRARVLIDASGRAGFVARKEGVRVADQALKKASIYAHFRGVPVDAAVRGGDTRIVALPQLGWMWFIPLADSVMSVGVVLDLADYQRRPKGDLATIFAEALTGSPLALRLLSAAERVSEFRAESGFSYRAARYGGDRWFLAGDAGSFLDPIFSTGVLMALRGGLDAATAASAAYLVPRPRPAAARRRFDRQQRRRYWFVRRFVTGFYDAATRDMFFAPRPGLGLATAVTKVLAGDFDLGLADRVRLRLFFLLGWLQRHFDLAPRLAEAVPTAPVEPPRVGQTA